MRHHPLPANGVGAADVGTPASRAVRLWRRAVACVAAGAVAVATSVAVVMPGHADTAPTDPSVPATVSADALPTVQVDGVVWQQAVVGNTVYAVGSFRTARPAGSAPGQNTVARNNILAFDIRTGALIQGFAPNLNAQAFSVAASPDGSRLYVGGSFTAVNGASVWRVAALNPTTGALITSFLPKPSSAVRAIVATSDTVYVGGTFNAVGGVTRTRLAAFNAADGALKPWAPVADGGQVNALAMSPDRSQLVVGGAFTTLNGSSNPGYGLGAVDPVTGALQPFAANGLIRNGGTEAAILHLAGDSTRVYGVGYVFGTSGNFEGTFSANWGDGSVHWVEDCHGDTYGVYPAENVVYTAGHAHYCGNIRGFPQTEPWGFHRALAFSTAATGTVTDDPYGYYNFAGNPAPTLLNWYPDLDTGTATGQFQGPWNVVGNSQYVVMGGEFRTVNNTAQQGLVRFAVKEIAPNRQGPRVTGSLFNPSVVSTAAGTARIAWQANWDRDNENLTYTVIRDGATASPIHTVQQKSTFWNRPSMGYVDSGLAPGSTHTYRVFATDAFGNQARSDSVTVTVASADTASPYADAVLADSPGSYWRLGEPGGSTAVDWAGWNDLAVNAGVTRGEPGAIPGDPNTASTFSGDATGFATTQTAIAGPDTFTAEAWIKTTTTAGGKIIGFGASSTGDSGAYDRHVFMDNSGRLWFGIWTGSAATLTTAASYNDGQWHHVAASLGPNGMALHVDGKRVGQRSDVTTGQPYSGFWRVGGDNLNGWPAQPASGYFTGSIDEVALYPSVLATAQVQAHYQASGRTLDVPKAPADAYGKAVFEAEPELYWRLDETGGPTAVDSGAQGSNGTYVTGVSLGAPGALATGTAATFDGSSGLLSSNAQFSNPSVYSEELWFSTTTGNGGKLIGFGNQPGGLSNNYDRHVYMETSGQLTFGVWTGWPNTITSPASYNDGQWHHVVATQSGEGMKLYVDGALVGTNPQTQAENYTGHWKVGSDNTWGPQPYFAGTIDEVAVYSTALTAEAVAQHHALGTGAPPPNTPPVAAFTASPAGLSVSVDGSGSSDADGSIVSYLWNFDDGWTGSGVTASHTYAAAGTYTVTLTVTDDDGAQHSALQEVTVTPPPPNAPPAASFTATAADLRVDVDGTGSTDADGTVVSHAWTFGDGGTATGPTASHTYATAGTFTVQLTVTDDDGATSQSSSQVTVTAPAGGTPLAADSFARTLASGWGSAETGGTWTLNGSATLFSVAAGQGAIRMAGPGAGPWASLGSVSSARASLGVAVRFDKAATGGGMFAYLVGRRVGTAEYQAKVRVASTGAVTVDLARVVNGTTTTLVTRTVAGLTYAAGDQLMVRMEVSGTGPTALAAKVWRAGSAEPSAWTATATDSAPELQAAGSVALRTYLSGSATNAPVTAFFDDFTVTSLP